MNLLEFCPFCHDPLISSHELHESSPITWFCNKKDCRAAGEPRIKIITISNGLVREVHFLTDKYQVKIYFFAKKTFICPYWVSSASLTHGFPMFVTETPIIIDEAPEIDFSNINDLNNKIKTWVTFS